MKPMPRDGQGYVQARQDVGRSNAMLLGDGPRGGVHVCAMGRGRQEAVLFWKKEPKNFCPIGPAKTITARLMGESLFASFSTEKEELFAWSLRSRAGAPRLLP
jgi:hypothetical protein